ncbi:HAD-IIIC family phosphatase [Nocardia takedensis]|uniref:HAD-IIIC family phosphatase n=1 Tax=Nocardia takedensis TaxID=259390 RepID=UPI0002E7D757|nr:HAD-IIIC family phosphatase [Nocardia takedensis]
MSATTLRDLHRTGDLIEHYRRVPALLAELSPEDLSRAGHVLAALDPDDILRAHLGLPAVRVAIIGHGTLGLLTPAVTAEFGRHGIVPRIRLGAFDGYVFELADPHSLVYADAPDLVLCVLDPMIVLDELPVPWTPDDVAEVLRRKLDQLTVLARQFAERGGATLVFNTIPLPRTLTAQVLDRRARARLGVLWREANARLLALAEDLAAVVVIDLDPLLSEGIAATEARLSVYAKAHLSGELLAAYAREIGHLARETLGRTKKVLALDLDETVWGGVLLEDGIDGIEVADTPRGEAFQAFQRVAKQLGSQGVLLAAVSKNDPEAVRAVLTEHPAMVLRDNDFVRISANWRPKPDNLRELADAVNVGADSFVFVDDSPSERGMVRRALPEVAVVAVDEPALHVSALLRDGWFDVRELTAEDRTRPAEYRAEVERADFLHTFDSIEDYLRELEVRVTVAAATPAQVGRLSQLTLRTNQFNLTTVRLQQPEILAMLEDPDRLVLVVRSADRFGDNGTVGAVFYRVDGQTGRIENFVLSCRVFSRGIEQAVLSTLLRHAHAHGVTEVTGTHRPTAKNSVVAGLYPKYGFTGPIPGADGAATFRHPLRDIVGVPGHIELIEEWEGTVR